MTAKPNNYQHGDMKWLGENEKSLHIYNKQYGCFLPYTHPKNVCFPIQPDTVLPGLRVSKGFRTAQIMLQKGYKYA